MDPRSSARRRPHAVLAALVLPGVGPAVTGDQPHRLDPVDPDRLGDRGQPVSRRWASSAWIVAVHGRTGRSTRSSTNVTSWSTSAQSPGCHGGIIAAGTALPGISAVAPGGCRWREAGWAGGRRSSASANPPARGSRRRSPSPPPAQAGAWEAISAGRHALVVAPTGSGKTLSAFLWSLDRLLTSEPRREAERCRVLYVSPLKALAVDVERNLRAPLTGIRHTAERLGERAARGDGRAAHRRHQRRRPAPADDHAARHPDHHARVAVPDADQPGPRVAARRRDRDRRRGPRRRRHQARRPPRGQPRAARRAARPPGAADRAVARRSARIEEVARFLGGQAPVEIVAPPSEKAWDLQVVVPVEDMTAPEEYDEEERRPEPQPVDLAPRRGARRRPDRAAPLHDRLRQQPSARRAADGPAQRDRRRPGRRRADDDGTPPAQIMAQSGRVPRRARRSSPRPTTARSPRSSGP